MFWRFAPESVWENSLDVRFAVFEKFSGANFCFLGVGVGHVFFGGVLLRFWPYVLAVRSRKCLENSLDVRSAVFKKSSGANFCFLGVGVGRVFVGAVLLTFLLYVLAVRSRRCLENSLDVRSFRRLVPAFFSVRFRVRPFFSPLPSPFFLLLLGSARVLLLLFSACAGRTSTPWEGRSVLHMLLSSFFLLFSFCPGRLPSPFPLSLSLSFSLLSLSLASMRVKQFGPLWKVQRDGDRLLVL